MQAISDFCITHSRTNLDGIIIIIGGDQDFNLDLLAARNGYRMRVEMFYNPYGIANSHLEGAADESHNWFDFLAKSLDRELTFTYPPREGGHAGRPEIYRVPRAPQSGELS